MRQKSFATPGQLTRILNDCSEIDSGLSRPHLSDEEFILYASETLQPAEMARLDDHIAACTECCLRLERLCVDLSPFTGPEGEFRLTALQRKLRLITRPSRIPFKRWVQAACLAFAAFAGVSIVRSSIQIRQPKIAEVTWSLGLARDPEVSVDGRQLVYASTAQGKKDLDIWLETLPAAHRLRLTSDSADDYSPSLAQGLVAFRSDRQAILSGHVIRGGIYIVPAHGGETKLIAPEGYGPQLSPDGKWLTYWTGDPAGDRSELYIVASRGGSPQRICAHCYSARHQVWSSDGHALLFWGNLQEANGQAGGTDWWVVPIHNGLPARLERTRGFPELRRIGIQGSMTPEAWHGDQLFFSVHGPTPGLWKVTLKGSEVVADDAVQLTRGSAFETGVSLSRGDRLYYSVLKARTNVWELPIGHGDRINPAMAQPITFDDANDGFPSLSKDGARLAFTSNRGGTRAIWLQDIKGDQERLVVNSDSLYDAPKLSPDGASIAYTIYDQRLKTWTLKVVASDDSKPASTFENIGPPMAWSPNGTLLLYSYDDPVPTKPYGAGVLNIQTGEKTVFQDAAISVFPNSFSPDGKWIAFHTLVGGDRKLWIARMNSNRWPALKDWVSATNEPSGSDMEAHWSPDGKTLYFLSDRDGHRCIWAQRLSPVSGLPIKQPYAVGHFHDPALSLKAVGTPGRVGLSVLPNKLVFAATQTAGNIWRMDFPETALRLPFLHW